MKRHSYKIQREIQTEVFVGQGLTKQILDKLKAKKQSAVLLITDSVLYELFGKSLEQKLSPDLKVATYVIPTGEDAKSWNTVTGLLEFLSAQNFDRHVVLVGLGGGTVSDVTGFAASIYLRGVDWYGYPTTLLAQVDAAIGGKTGVNLNNIKNRIGSFYQPQAVFADTEVLKSLPEREFRSGMAEVIKYGVSLDKSLFEQLEKLPTLSSRSRETLAKWERDITQTKAVERDPSGVPSGTPFGMTVSLEDIIFKCIQLKSRIVAKDELETTGLRQVLNFGHTFGHAVETVAEKGRFTHGEAVAIGMMFAMKLSKEINLCDHSEVKRVQTVLEKYGLSTSVKLPIDKLMEKMMTDKKVVNGKIQWVLVNGIGNAVVGQVVEEGIIRKVLKSL